MSGKIYKWSKFYFLLSIYIKFAHWLFYRKYLVVNKSNIPKNEPVIFAPNHQNALMDALAILCSSWQQVVFLARADIFKNKKQAAFLRKIKILPVFRIRDGADSLQQNDEIFDQCVDLLTEKKSMSLFPETTHIGKRHLQPLKKGIPRIAFMTAEKNNFQQDIKIVPVGIYYSGYEKCQSFLRVEFGKPIQLNKFKDLYQINPQKAMIALKDEMTVEIRKLIVDVHNLKLYDVYQHIVEIFDYTFLKNRRLKNCFSNRYLAEQHIVEKIKEIEKNDISIIESFQPKTQKYFLLLEKFKIRDWLFDKQYNTVEIGITIVTLLVLLPIYLYGVILNIVAFKIPELKISTLKDPQFRSSFRFVIAIIIFPIFYLIISIFLFLCIQSFSTTLMFLISLPLSGWLAIKYHIFVKKIIGIIRMIRLRKSNSREFNEMLNFRNEVIIWMSSFSE